MNLNEIKDPSVIGKERADRLRRLRNLANLSRKELCDGANININTYIGYEVVRYGGLTKKGADKVVRYIATKGVYTTIEWLMYDLGPGPQVITDDIQDVVGEDVCKPIFDHSQEMQKIAEEVYLFHRHYKPAMECRIDDDGMSPKYDVGDYVAGILYSGSPIGNLVGLDCIVKTTEGQLLVRSLCNGRVKGHYTLTCNNPKTTVIHPVLHDVKLISAAYIIWHRRVYRE
jgi:hypothetical protein